MKVFESNIPISFSSPPVPAAASAALEGGREHPPPATWGVRFDEEGTVPIVIGDGDAEQYEKQVIAQMAAAAAQAS